MILREGFTHRYPISENLSELTQKRKTLLMHINSISKNVVSKTKKYFRVGKQSYHCHSNSSKRL